MTRKNVADGVREIMTCECPVCEGTGRVLSDESLAIDMLRNLRRIARESKSEAFRVELEDGVARALIGTGGAGLDELEHETGRAFDVVGRVDVPREHFADRWPRARSTRSAPGAALRAGRRAQPADARAAPLRRDRRRVAAQRRLRGTGHRRAALRGHDAAPAHRARDALRRPGRAARRRAGAPGGAGAAAADRRGRRRRGRGQGLRHPRARAPRRRAARRRGSRAPAEAPHDRRAAPRARRPAPSGGAGGGGGGPPRRLRSPPATATSRPNARRRSRARRRRRGGGQAPPPPRWSRSPRSRRRQRRAHAGRERRCRGRRQRRPGRAWPRL